eukprot:scaffold791_cov115-Cylindrotheca_fusiformis.AAC.5
MDVRKKRKRAEREEVDPEVFVYTSETKDADIPKETLTHLRVDSSVTEIPANAFQGCESLVQVQLPETLTSIGKSTFNCCLSLERVQFISNTNHETSSVNQSSEDGTIVFPDKATQLQVDESAFSLCHGLRKIIVCSVSTKLSRSSFSCCEGLISVQLPQGLRILQPRLFQQCHSLVSVQIPSSVIIIDEFCFLGCESLVSFDLPPGLQQIGVAGFYGCHSIETLDIPSTVNIIGKNAFSACISLKYLKLPEALETVEEILFYGCRSLEYIEIPTAVKAIGEMAFRFCSSLSHIRIPPSVKFIAQCAFTDCPDLISIELPEAVTFGDDNRTSGFSIKECSSLVNVALPSLTGDLLALPRMDGNMYFGQASLLRGLKFDSVVDGLEDLDYKLKHRFDNYPLHKLCYYQSYCSTDEAMAKLQSLMDDDPLAATCESDDFGMTPLHILSLSQNPNLKMLIAVINAGHPDHIVRDWDSFGSNPMDYLCLNKMPNSKTMIQSLLQATLVKRLDWLGLERWKSDLLQAAGDALEVDWSSRRKEIGAVYFKLANYERKEILSLMELFLWKLKIHEVGTKESADRLWCRINSGASIVVDNVLPFLDDIDMEDYVP